MKNIIKNTLITFATGVLAVSTIALPASAASKTITVGLVGTSDQEVWEKVAHQVKRNDNITVKTKIFTDYNTPNQALLDGSLDLNAFQHVDFFNNWNQAHHNQLKILGKTYLTPMRIYSKKVKTVTDLTPRATVALPNDPTNEGRALKLLQTAGLIKLNHQKQPTVKDVKDNKLRLKFKTIAAEQIPIALKSVDAAVINTNYAQEAKLPLNRSIYVEPLNHDAKPWINVIAVSKKHKNDAAYQKVLKAYQSKNTKQYFKQRWGDTQVPAWDIKLK
ncbi:MetQ/NlpA family ABC transporter substrate-binding protein [Weissella kandleri]|uniref:MetQ/NlpA family ABC transporter substrate-binding protein n=1 Tax=Weissella kandleri TaxID=1616 RepID=UPI00387EE0D0